MTFSKEDRVLIKVLRMEKGYTCWKFLNEFPGKNWNRRALYRLIAQIDAVGNAGRKQGRGRPRSGRSEANIETDQDMILSQDDAPCTHRTFCQISRETGISKSSVHHIIHK